MIPNGSATSSLASLRGPEQSSRIAAIEISVRIANRLEQPRQRLKSDRRNLGGFHVPHHWVHQLQRHPTVVADGLQLAQDCRELKVAVTGHDAVGVRG